VYGVDDPVLEMMTPTVAPVSSRKLSRMPRAEASRSTRNRAGLVQVELAQPGVAAGAAGQVLRSFAGRDLGEAHDPPLGLGHDLLGHYDDVPSASASPSSPPALAMSLPQRGSYWPISRREDAWQMCESVGVGCLLRACRVGTR